MDGNDFLFNSNPQLNDLGMRLYPVGHNFVLETLDLYINEYYRSGISENLDSVLDMSQLEEKLNELYSIHDIVIKIERTTTLRGIFYFSSIRHKDGVFDKRMFE